MTRQCTGEGKEKVVQRCKKLLLMPRWEIIEPFFDKSSGEEDGKE